MGYRRRLKTRKFMDRLDDKQMNGWTLETPLKIGPTVSVAKLIGKVV